MTRRRRVWPFVVLIVLVAGGCGGFLPFGDDDDDDEPAPAPTGDAAVDGDATTSEGSTGPIDAGTWRCLFAVDAGGPTFADEPSCDQARLGQCAALVEPTGACDRVTSEQQTACSTCQKNTQGNYTYSSKVCVCR